MNKINMDENTFAKNVKSIIEATMFRKCELKPGMDTAEFIIKFNEMNFDIMAALDLDHETGLYGLVFFERTQIIKLSWIQKLVKKIFKC